jgi:hypothetical protein
MANKNQNHGQRKSIGEQTEISKQSQQVVNKVMTADPANQRQAHISATPRAVPPRVVPPKTGK